MILSDLYEQLKAAMPEHDARFLLKQRLNINWSDLLTAKSAELIPESDLNQILQDLKQVQSGEPLSRILGQREFWGLNFTLNEDTLDPRPDTEILVERTLEHFGKDHPEWLLDIGTGTGCIPIALLKEWPNTKAVATDLSLKALQCAQHNARQNNVDSRIFFINTQWFSGIGHIFDCITSNPPYIRQGDIQNLDENVQNYDPILALDGGKNGLQAYEKIFSSIHTVLKPQGRAFFEIGYDQSEDMMRLGKKYRIRIEDIFADYAGIPRVVDISCGDK